MAQLLLKVILSTAGKTISVTIYRQRFIHFIFTAISCGNVTTQRRSFPPLQPSPRLENCVEWRWIRFELLPSAYRFCRPRDASRFPLPSPLTAVLSIPLFAYHSPMRRARWRAFKEIPICRIIAFKRVAQFCSRLLCARQPFRSPLLLIVSHFLAPKTLHATQTFQLNSG